MMRQGLNKTAIAAISAVIALLFYGAAIAADWEQVDGPYDGNVTSFVKDTSTGKLYATGTGIGLGGGVFVSADNGNTWARVAGNSQLGETTVNNPPHYGSFYENIGLPSVSGLKAGNVKLGIDNSTSPATLYFSYFYTAAPSRVYRSTDEGANWTVFTAGLAAGFQPHGFAHAPNGDMFVAGFQGTGVYRLPDGGSTWVACTTTVTNAFAIAVDQNNGDIYFTNPQNTIDPNRPAVFRSTDNGTSFTGVTISTSVDTLSGTAYNRLLNSIAIDNSITPPVIHLGLKDRFQWMTETYIATGGHFRSTDYGATWVSGTAINVESLAVDSSGRVFLGTKNNSSYYGEIYVSTDRGISFNKINQAGINDAASVYSLFACSPGTVFAGADGAYRSTDNGATWTHLANSGLKACRRTTDVAIGPDGTIYSSSNEHGVSRSEDGGATWIISNGTGASRIGSLYVNTIGVDPVTGYVFAGTGLVNAAVTGMWRSTNKGASWTKVAGFTCQYKAMDITFAKNGNIIFGGMFGGPGGVWVSTDGGVSAVQAVNPYAGVPIYSLAVNNVTGDIYAGTETEATWLSTDHGVTYASLTYTGAYTNGCSNVQGNHGNIFSVAVDSTGNTVYEVALRGLYKTNDKGVTWQEIAVPGLGACGQSGQAVLTDPNGYVYYYYTEGAPNPPKLQRSMNSGSAWAWFNTGLPTDSRGVVGTQSMAFNPFDGKVYTGMSGNTANIKQGTSGLFRTEAAVYTPLASPTNTGTATPVVSPTLTRTATGSATVSATGTATSAATATYTLTASPAASQADTGTYTMTQTPAITSTYTETASGTSTRTMTISPSYTATHTMTATAPATAAETVIASPSGTVTLTPSLTAVVSMTWTETITETLTINESLTATPAVSSTFTPAVSSTPSVTATATQTEAVSPTETRTETQVSSLTSTPVNTAIDTETPQASASVSATAAWTMTATPSITPFSTPVSTPTITPTSFPAGTAMFFTEKPVLYPNPSLGGAFSVRFTASKPADFKMKIFTDGLRKVAEIKRDSLAPVQNIVSASIPETGSLAAGIYYYVITLKDAGGTAVSAPPSHFIVLRQE